MSHIGFIKLHRKLLNWEWYTDVPVKTLFLHLLLAANHKDTRHCGQLIKRGQLITGREELAKSTGLTIQQVRTALLKLKSTNEITIKSTSKGTLIELINYNLYQTFDKENSQHFNQEVNQRITSYPPTINQQVTTNNNEKNEKNNKKESPHGDTLNSSPLIGSSIVVDQSNNPDSNNTSSLQSCCVELVEPLELLADFLVDPLLDSPSNHDPSLLLYSPGLLGAANSNDGSSQQIEQGRTVKAPKVTNLGCNQTTPSSSSDADRQSRKTSDAELKYINQTRLNKLLEII